MERIIGLVFLLVAYCSVGQVDFFYAEPTVKTENLKGPVKLVKVNGFIGVEKDGENVISEPGWPGGWQKDSKSFYDSLGQLYRKEYYSTSGVFSFSRTFRYEGPLLLESKTIHKHRFFEYDDIGRLKVELLKYYEPSVVRSGREEPLDKSTFNRIEYFYNSNGNLMRKMETSTEHQIARTDSFFYDTLDNPIQVLTYYRDIIECQKIRYDDQNRIIEHSIGDNEDGLIEKTSLRYLNGMLTVEDWELFSNFKSNGKVIVTYVDGNESSIIETEDDGEIVYEERLFYSKFDKYGNWLEQISIEDESEIGIVHRTIEYH